MNQNKLIQLFENGFRVIPSLYEITSISDIELIIKELTYKKDELNLLLKVLRHMLVINNNESQRSLRPIVRYFEKW